MSIWTADPEAIELIASCAKDVPAKRFKTIRYAVSSDTFEFYARRDPRVRRLNEIANKYLDDALVAGDTELAKLNATTVEQEIDAAIANRKVVDWVKTNLALLNPMRKVA